MAGVAFVGMIATLAGPDWSGCHGGQPDDWSIAQGPDGFLRHVAAALNGPCVIMFEQDRADERKPGKIPALAQFRDAQLHGSNRVSQVRSR